MKRKTEKVPGFDEIIFENRNKEYGAYDIRKRYQSTTSISIIGGVAFFAIIVSALSISTENGKASDGPTVVTIVMADPIQHEVAQPEIKPPVELTAAIKNLAPVVTEDTSEILVAPPTNDDLLNTARDRDIRDTSSFYEPPDPVIPPVTEPFVRVEEMPEFPGGESELLRFISKNIVYPEDAIINNIQGRVILQFVVNPDGSIDRIHLLRSIDTSLDNEAIRVVKTLPKFKPGKQGGVPVPVWFSLPVLFRLENN